MAKRKRKQKKKQEEEVLVDIVEARDQAQSFIEENQTLFIGALLGVALVIGGLFVYRNFIVKPKQQEAISQVYAAQNQFERDSFILALTKPGGEALGLADVVKEYGSTKTGNLSHYYAGLSHLQLGQFDAAISYLSDFNAKGNIMPILKNGLLGDAYSEKQEMDKAISFYQKAVSAGDNDIFTPYYLQKLGMLNEYLNQPEPALKAYQELKSKYPESTYGKDVDKYITRLLK